MSVYKVFLWIVSCALLHGSYLSALPTCQKLPSSQKKLIKILSIEGGGIRGLIPALILKELESKLTPGKHLAESFDVIAGTSSGGLTTLLLTTPGKENRPKYTASDIVNFYHDLGNKLFYRTLLNSIWNFRGWFTEKYSATNFEQTALEAFGATRLSQAVTNIMVTAFDIHKDNTLFFKKTEALTNPTHDFYFKDIARATTAAPTFFPPARITDVTKTKSYTLIDGAVSINNPSLAALMYAVNFFGCDNDFLIVSIGVGSYYGINKAPSAFKAQNKGGLIDWVPKFIDLTMYASNELVDEETAILCTPLFEHRNSKKTYYRFQTHLPLDQMHRDNVSPENVAALEKHGRDLIQKHQKDLTEIATLLNEK